MGSNMSPVQRKDDIPIIDLTADSGGEEEELADNAIMCPVCYDDLLGKSPVATTCGHLYCFKCLRTWMKNCADCPMCKKPLDASDFFRIYLEA